MIINYSWMICSVELALCAVPDRSVRSAFLYPYLMNVGAFRRRFGLQLASNLMEPYSPKKEMIAGFVGSLPAQM